MKKSNLVSHTMRLYEPSFPTLFSGYLFAQGDVASQKREHADEDGKKGRRVGRERMCQGTGVVFLFWINGSRCRLGLSVSVFLRGKGVAACLCIIFMAGSLRRVDFGSGKDFDRVSALFPYLVVFTKVFNAIGIAAAARCLLCMAI